MKLPHLQKQPFFYVLLVGVFILSYFVLKPFLSAIVLAFLAALFFKPVFRWYVALFKGRKKLAALVSVVVVFIVVLVPLLAVSGLTVNQVLQFKDDFSTGEALNAEKLAEYLNNVSSIVPGLDDSITTGQVQDWMKTGAKAMGTFFLERLPDIGSGAFNFFTWVLVFIILLYSLFPVQDKLVKFLQNLSPLEDSVDRLYITRVIEMSKSMVKGTFLVALVQGVISGIILAVVGVDYVLFLTILMIFLGVIPMVGSGFVMVPIGLIMLLTGAYWQGLVVLLGMILIVGNIDNYIRPKSVSKKAELHPALVILGVIGGLQVFGAMGFIYGPVIMILLVTTVQMYMESNKEHANTTNDTKPT